MTVAKFGATPASRRAKVQQRILRACSIAVVGLVALLMMSAVVATMVGGESDRAVVNAPVALITTPIEGELQSLAVVAGQTVEAGALVARVTNPRVDRSALLNLEERSSTDRERVRAARDKYQSDLQYISSLNEEINLLTAALKRKLEAEIAEQQSLFAEAQAASGEKKAILDRQNAMVSRGIYNIEMSRPSEYQYAAAQYRGEAARSKLDKATAQLAALEKGIYVGDDLVTIATLVQKRRDIELDAERMAIEERELSAQDATRRSLIAEERQRLDRGMSTFRRYGLLAVLVPSILPPPAPFKIFILLAGVARVRLSTFALAIGIGRGLRYFTEGLLAVWYGDRAIEYLQNNAEPAALVAAGVILLGGIIYVFRSRRADSAARDIRQG